MTDRARPGLVALYNIRPGNGAGQFLQPRKNWQWTTLQLHRTESIASRSVLRYTIFMLHDALKSYV